uniref:Uncharacterized protein n=1 Tax=Candidatus Kentrum sp. MB TaxID=2138164 RepID=A0A450XV06_9GAMM|nr:MAG: hypothetical protein BECKMB1821G_GA0114241_103813 [Candidatus Kentron sp. MB]VFK33105.1 MAG: hypothetical protein BECKMB1821I_GA0114274_104013 [Candidatus Kentron sp. MB]VFK76059.1 MAG: hypothetical protein BECKMB1821H_GA0114242_104013 [Candidatus Kentron sp. MB]
MGPLRRAPLAIDLFSSNVSDEGLCRKRHKLIRYFSRVPLPDYFGVHRKAEHLSLISIAGLSPGSSAAMEWQGLGFEDSQAGLWPWDFFRQGISTLSIVENNLFDVDIEPDIVRVACFTPIFL